MWVDEWAGAGKAKYPPLTSTGASAIAVRQQTQLVPGVSTP